MRRGGLEQLREPDIHVVIDIFDLFGVPIETVSGFYVSAGRHGAKFMGRHTEGATASAMRIAILT